MATYIVKAFASYDPWISNTPGVTAGLGELHPIAQTFSMDKQVGTDSEVTVTIFSNSNQTSTTNTQVRTSSTTMRTLLNMGIWIYTASGANFSSTASFTTKYNAATPEEITGVATGTKPVLSGVGDIVNDGTHKLPGFIEFTYQYPSGDSTTTVNITLWFSANTFNIGYPLGSARTICGLEDADLKKLNDGTLFTSVSSMVSNLNLTTLMDKVYATTNGLPYTKLRVDEFTWVSTNTNNTVRVPFVTILNGFTDDNIESVKDNVKAKLTSLGVTGANWSARFPSIYDTSEFVILPMWRRESSSLGLNLPFTLLGGLTTLMNKVAIPITSFASSSTSASVNTNSVEMGVTLYNSLAFAVVGANSNMGGKRKLSSLFPDYIIATTTQDANRMSQTTRAFQALLEKMFIEAARYHPSQPIIEAGIDRVLRTYTDADGSHPVHYVATTYLGYRFLMVTKYTVNDPASGV